ncbi:MAG: hypothetical protein WBE99_15015 [Xanthobacteraceae bacterium]
MSQTSPFTGGISNSGTISSTGVGGIPIILDGGSTFSGGISNSGTIAARDGGIFVENTSTFSGGISNSGFGKIIGGTDGIVIGSGVSTFIGGISNSGTISDGNIAITVRHVTNFFGGITNSGTIAATHGHGIKVTNVTQFDSASAGGGIFNFGRISAGQDGILVKSVSTFSGAISNSGTISAGAGNDGIYVTAVTQFGSGSAGGGISNSGTISAGGFGI